MIFFQSKSAALYLIFPIGEGTAVTAGPLEKICNLVHFYEKCHKIHYEPIIIDQKVL